MTLDDIIISENLDDFIHNGSGNENDYVLIVFCRRGSMQVEVNSEQFSLFKNDLMLCMPEFLIGNYVHSSDFQSEVIALRPHALDEIIYLCIREDNRWWEKVQYINVHPILHLSARQSGLIDAFNMLLDIYKEYEMTAIRQRTINILAQACINEMLSWVEEVLIQEDETKASTRQEELFSRFINLVSQTHGAKREVRWYASQLAISPKYLSTICNDIRGTNASTIINYFTTQELKRLLQSTNLSAKEISHRLGFTNFSFFCKYVRRHLGMNLTEYRELKQKS